MANFITANANIRLSNYDGKSICSVSGINPAITADTAASFVDAIEKIYNNGQCAARMSIFMNINRGSDVGGGDNNG